MLLIRTAILLIKKVCHLKVAHGKIEDFKNIECNQCGYRCTNYYTLTKHIEAVHDKIKDEKCDKWDYSTGFQKCFGASQKKCS